MDLATVAASTICSAGLFLILEFTVILPLFTRVVRNAVDGMVNEKIIPSITAYIDTKIGSLQQQLADALWLKIRAMLGGRTKGVNNLINRLAAGESLEELETQYQESTVEQVLTILSAVASRLPSPTKEVSENGKEKEKHSQGSQPSQELFPFPSQEGQAQ